VQLQLLLHQHKQLVVVAATRVVVVYRGELAMEKLRKLKHGELVKVAEVLDRSRFLQRTFENKVKSSNINKNAMDKAGFSGEKFKTMLNGGLLTYLLHW
jgi:hypothetical protein